MAKFKYISDKKDYRHLTDKDRYTKLYEEVGQVEANLRIEWREEWMKYFIPKENSKILELGSHNGPNLLYYAERGHQIHGVELSQTLIDTFEKYAASLNPEIKNRIKLTKSWIEDFLIDEKYNYILVTEVLEHVIDPVKILEVAEKHLENNGIIYISSPTTHWGNNTHVRGVPSADLTQWLDLVNLVPVKIWEEKNRTFCLAQKKDEIKIFGMIRVRNEEDIIGNSLDHLTEFCTGGIIVYDDCSTDGTAALCNAHKNVLAVINNTKWDENRERAEFENRAELLAKAKQYAGNKDWLVYVDADERIDFDWETLAKLPANVLAIRMKLFDFYITAVDVNEQFYNRKWMGPEYREIIFAFRNLPTLSYTEPDQREVNLGTPGEIFNAGFVKHFGKALSVQRWERKCDYYAAHFPKYSEKWNSRKGKAIHSQSDFGFDLIRWEEKEFKGVKLTPQIEANATKSIGAQRNPQLKNFKILLTNHHLTDFTGSELYTYTLAVYLKKFGSEVVVYSKYIGKIFGIFEQAGIRVINDLAAIKNEKFDIAHVHHNINAIEVRANFPSLPIVFLSHGILPFLEQPPMIDVKISKYLAISEEVKENLIYKGVNKNKIEVVRNLIDPQKFGLTKALNKIPQKALILSGRIDDEKENIIKEACKRLNITSRFIGGRFGTVPQNEVVQMINDSDIVFSLGRGAIESMFCGRIPIIYDYLGGDGIVTPTTFEEIKKNNFSGRRYKKDFTVEELIDEIKKYDPAFGPELRSKAIKEFSAEVLAEKLIGIYQSEAGKKVSIIKHEDLKSLDFTMNVINETRNYSYDLGVKQSAGHIRRLEETIQVLQNRQFVEKESIHNFASYEDIFKLIENENYDEAIREVENYKTVTEQLLLNPDINCAYSRLSLLTGFIMLGLGEINTAENLFTDQLKITPQLNEAIIGLTLAEYALAKDDEAVAHLNLVDLGMREAFNFNFTFQTNELVK